MKHETQAITLRSQLRSGDAKKIEQLLAGTGVFSEEEVALGAELAKECIESGSEQSGYHFILLENEGGEVKAYANYGPIPITEKCWDFYWMAVEPESQGKGYASLLTQAVFEEVLTKGGRQIFAEVSSLPASEPIRRCHAKNGFERMAVFEDFYKEGDAKIIYRKIL